MDPVAVYVHVAHFQGNATLNRLLEPDLPVDLVYVQSVLDVVCTPTEIQHCWNVAKQRLRVLSV